MTARVRLILKFSVCKPRNPVLPILGALFMPETDDGINAHRPACRNQASKQSHRDQDD